MNISSHIHDDVTIIRIDEDRIDAGSAAEMKNTLFSIIDEGNRHLAVDLSKVLFVDSSGLSSLVALKRRVSPAGGKIGIWGLTPNVRSLFELTQLYKVFEIFENEIDTIDFLKENGDF